MAKIRALLACAGPLLLAGCMGGGMSGIDTGTTTATSKNPSIVDPATDGEATAATLEKGQAISARFQATNVVKPTYSSTLQSYRSDVSLTSNGLGGYTFNYSTPGSKYGPYINTTLISADQVSGSKDAWQRSWTEYGTKYSLALWNAGKGHREGLARNEDGQTFHKIIGYYASSDQPTYGFNARGHGIIGNPTAETVLANRTRTANYEGYFYTNALVAERGDLGSPTGVRGGMTMNADFNANTISGSSTNLEVEEGAGNFVAKNHTVTFGTASIVEDYRGPMGVLVGQHYEGKTSSSFAPLNNATFEGRFYGGNAQETAGIIQGQNAGIITEGYFTLVEKK